MEIVIKMKTEDYQKVRELLLKDDTVSRASIVFKDVKEFGDEEGYYCYVSGLEEQCKKALELIKDEEGNMLAEEVEGEKKEKIIDKIKEEGDKADEAFGGIFG